MVRIAGVNLKDRDKIDYALTNIKGIGWTSSKKVIFSLKLDPQKRISDLSAEEIAKIAAEVEKYSIEGDLFRAIRGNIARLKQIGTYRGLRHTKGLPVRGQRTKTNARTKRGKRKTVGAFKKEALAKQTTSQKIEK